VSRAEDLFSQELMRFELLLHRLFRYGAAAKTRNSLMADASRNRPVRSTLELIGNTPMVELTRFDTGHAGSSPSSRTEIPAGRSRTASAFR